VPDAVATRKAQLRDQYWSRGQATIELTNNGKSCRRAIAAAKSHRRIEVPHKSSKSLLRGFGGKALSSEFQRAAEPSRNASPALGPPGRASDWDAYLRLAGTADSASVGAVRTRRGVDTRGIRTTFDDPRNIVVGDDVGDEQTPRWHVSIALDEAYALRPEDQSKISTSLKCHKQWRECSPPAIRLKPTHYVLRSAKSMCRQCSTLPAAPM